METESPTPDMSAFKLLYEGDRHDIDAEVLLESVASVTRVVEEINDTLGDDRAIDIRITAPERGSFGIDLSVWADNVAQIVSPETVTYTSSIISILVGAMQLHRWLAGEDPESVEEEQGTVRIDRPDGTTITVDKTVANLYMGNQTIVQELNQHYRALRRDESIEGFTLQDPETGERQLEVPREEFKDLGGKNRPDRREREVVDKEVRLTVVRVVFEQKRRWEFLRNGERLSAPIEDLGFWARLEHREEGFFVGDRMIVDLEKKQEFDPAVNDWVTKDHAVVHVHDHISRGKQGNIFGEEE